MSYFLNINDKNINQNEFSNYFPFPFPPYPQQQQLMEVIYDTINTSSIGCFESPTGTGKSLSLICSALLWQQNEENSIISKLEEQEIKNANNKSININKVNNKVEDDWLSVFSNNYQAKKQVDNDNNDNKDNNKKSLENYKLMKKKLAKYSVTKPKSSNDINISSTSFNDNGSSIIRNVGIKINKVDDEFDEFALPNYESGDDKVDDGNDNSHIDNEDDNEDEIIKLPQIIYCSRTHSQISQFVNEIKSTIFKDIRCITLGSRKQMCINETVVNNSANKSDSKISEICLEMQKNKTKTIKNEIITIHNTIEIDNKKKKLENTIIKDIKKKQKLNSNLDPCQYHKRSNERDFVDFALSKIRDIEELSSLGKQVQGCPYYSARRAIKNAQVICMPYNVILHEDLRNSMGINLKNNIIVFDEAHNLVEAINHTHSAEISLQQINIAIDAINNYLTRFQILLNGKNVYYVNILLFVIRGLKQVLLHKSNNTIISSNNLVSMNNNNNNNNNNNYNKENKVINDEIKCNQSTETITSNEFLFSAKLDNINLYKLKRHIDETHLVNKIGKFTESQEKKKKNEKELNDALVKSTSSTITSVKNEEIVIDEEDVFNNISPTTSLRNVINLIKCLTNSDVDGRVVVTTISNITNKDKSIIDINSSIKFVLLNPSIYFRKVVDQTKSIILLGGTMKPFSYFTSFLFPHIEKNKINTFSCGHVVSNRSIKPLILSVGVTGKTLEFTHDKRLLKDTIVELHTTLMSICTLVPNGIVVFFTSYSYMEALLSKWKELGILKNLIQPNRPLYIEPRSSVESEKIWSSYSKHATINQSNDGKCSGALLFCVMGGKLSEGINFSDRLARCVVVVGLPYPDGRDVLLQEKLKYADSKEAGSGKKLYEAMCMKVVNQSIGRSIRHINDYSSILLIDQRYSNDRVNSQLPNWIKQCLTNCTTFSQTKYELQQFFLNKTN